MGRKALQPERAEGALQIIDARVHDPQGLVQELVVVQGRGGGFLRRQVDVERLDAPGSGPRRQRAA